MTEYDTDRQLMIPANEKEASCDMHVHSDGSSDTIPLKFTRVFGVKESYSSPENIYKIAKERGRSLVTTTDHNSL